MLTTYAGDTSVLRAIKPLGAICLKARCIGNCSTQSERFTPGENRCSAEASYELAEHATDDVLTPAEVRVLRLIAEGNANKEIAEQLAVSEETVKGQVRNILSKLGAKDRTQAAMIGSSGWVSRRKITVVEINLRWRMAIRI